MMSKKTALTLFLVAFIYRLIILSNSNITFFSDDAIYAILARFFANGDVYHAIHPTWPPLYPLLAAIFHLVSSRWETALQLVSTVAGSLLPIPLYMVAKKYLDQKSTATFAILTSFFDPLITESLMPLSDMLSSLLTICFIFTIFFYLSRPNKKLIILAAVFNGLIYLTRSEGFMFFSLTSAFLVMFHVLSKRKLIAFVGFFVFTFLLITSPYTVTMSQRFHKISFTQKASAQIKQGRSFELRKNGTTWSQVVVSVKDPNYSSDYFTGGLGHVLEYGDWYWWWFLEKGEKWINLYWKLFPVWASVFLFIGIIKSFKKKYFWSIVYIIFISTISILATIFATPSTEIRYLLWLFPILIFFFSKGVYETAKYARLKKFSFLIVGMLLLFLPTFSTQQILHPIAFAHNFTQRHFRPEILLAKEYIKNDTDKKSPKIMMRHEALEFYVEGTTIYTPEVPIEEIIEYARKNDVDYLISWTFELANDKELLKIVDPNSNIEGLVPVLIVPELIVYKLNNE